MKFTYGKDSHGAEKKVCDFFNRHSLLTFSTVGSDGLPESSVLEFFTHEFDLFVCTERSSRKYTNLQTNNNVAIVIGGYEEMSVQYEGVATEIHIKDLPPFPDRELASHIRQNIYIGQEENMAYFCIKPRWLRYLNVGVSPWEQFEIEFPQ